MSASTPGIPQLWSDGCVASGVCIFQALANVWSYSFVFFLPFIIETWFS